MIRAREMRKGKVCLHDGELYVCQDNQHVAKGNKRSYMQAKLKNLKSGQTIDVRFRVDDQLETPFIETKEYEYLYKDGSGYVLMDTTTYDQITIDGELLGDGIDYLKENMVISAQITDGNIIGIEMPHVVELAVKDTPPVVKGATATNQSKEAILETGIKVRVPPFIQPGELLRIDTRTGEYLERAKSK